jgi:hypothetical protein
MGQIPPGSTRPTGAEAQMMRGIMEQCNLVEGA